jgi:hypothetical protein
MASPLNIDGLSKGGLKAAVAQLLAEIAELKQVVTGLREENARLKKLNGRPRIKPSGMEKESSATLPSTGRSRRRRGKKKTTEVVHEEKIIKAADVPAGSRFKGYQSFVVQDLVLHPQVTRYLRERWLTPEGRTIIAPLPGGAGSHFGPDLQRFILFQYHQGQVTVPRLVEQLRAFGVEISQRQIMRILISGKRRFIEEAREVLRAGLSTAAWFSADDTGARHKGANGICTQIGNEHFAWFGTTLSKSRLNFLELLRAGHTDYVINGEALTYMRKRNLSGAVITLLAGHDDKCFADEAAWTAHLEQLDVTALKVTPDPVRIATEGALWGSIKNHGFLRDTVILSDDAGQFNVALHALCWVHAERLVHKLEAFTERNRKAQQKVRGLIWRFYRALGVYRLTPSSRRKAQLSGRFDRIFKRETGFATLDRLLKRLHANKAELLRVLDRPEIPLHTNGSENDIRCQVTKRKVSGGTRSDDGRDCRDAFLGLKKTCAKLKIAFWDYLGARLGAANQPGVPCLAEIVKQRCASA